MRDPKRIDPILEELRALWKVCPDLRLGQLLVNFTSFATDGRTQDPFYVEDDKMREGMRKFALQLGKDLLDGKHD